MTNEQTFGNTKYYSNVLFGRLFLLLLLFMLLYLKKPEKVGLQEAPNRATYEEHEEKHQHVGPHNQLPHILYNVQIFSLIQYTLQRQNAENLKQIFSEKEYRGLSPNFHIHVSVSELYIPTLGLPFLLEELC